MTEPNEQTTEVLVLGSINQDVSVPVDRLPTPGETVLGGDALWSPGGKGANQAVAAARLGRRVMMVGAVGDDPVGADLLAGLAGEGIALDGVRTIKATSTGLATIAVSAEGENSIVVSPGANAHVAADDVRAVLERHVPPVVLTQCEVPPAAHEALVALPDEALLVLNPAPAAPIDAGVLARVDVLVPNLGELALLVGAEPAESSETDVIVDQVRMLGVAQVVVTLGGAGALVVDGETWAHLPAQPVVAVDTTAAGDSFCGGLVDGLLAGADLEDAARWATRVAAVTVTRRGAQRSLPSRAEVESRG